MGVNKISLRPLAAAYVQARVVGIGGMMTGFVVAAFLRGVGDTRTPLAAMVVANVVNAVLNYALLFGKPYEGPQGGTTREEKLARFASDLGATEQRRRLVVSMVLSRCGFITPPEVEEMPTVTVPSPCT